MTSPCSLLPKAVDFLQALVKGDTCVYRATIWGWGSAYALGFFAYQFSQAFLDRIFLAGYLDPALGLGQLGACLLIVYLPWNLIWLPIIKRHIQKKAETHQWLWWSLYGLIVAMTIAGLGLWVYCLWTIMTQLRALAFLAG